MKVPYATFEIVSGVEGIALYVNDYRVSGPKPWGGGTSLHFWTVPADDLRHALEQAPRAMERRPVKAKRVKRAKR